MATYPLPEVIVNGVTPDHNDIHRLLHNDWNKRYETAFYVGPAAAGAASGKDKVAALAAWTAANATTYGGIVVFAPGFYDVGDLALVWPAAPKTITIAGSGRNTTIVKFSVDGAAGAFALTGAGFGAKIRDLTISGPGSSFVLGTSPANLTGVKMSSRSELVNVTISGFKAGVQITGDHDYMQSVKVQNCFYAEYYHAPTTAGDHPRIDCDFTGNMRASIGVSPTGRLDAATYLRCHFGFSPFGIEFEAGGAAGWGGMTDCQFIGTAWEYCGNGWIYNSDRNVLSLNVQITGARPFTYNAAFKIAALAVQPDVYVGTVTGWHIVGDGFTNWDCTIIRNSVWEGWKQAYARTVAAGSTFLRAYMGLSGLGGTFRLNDSDSRAAAYNVTAAVAAGQVVEHTNARHYVRPHNPSAVNGGSIVAGVAITAATSGTDVCIVTDEDLEGQAVQVAGAGPYGVNDMLFAVGTTGKVDNVAGAGTYANRAIIGRVGDTLTVSGGQLANVIIKVTDRAT